MSRKVVEDLVLPIVYSIMMESRVPGLEEVDVRSERLLNFLESQLIRRFSIIGNVSRRCPQLESVLRSLDPLLLEELIEELLNRYVDLKLKQGEIMPNPYFQASVRKRKPIEIIQPV